MGIYLRQCCDCQCLVGLWWPSLGQSPHRVMLYRLPLLFYEELLLTLLLSCQWSLVDIEHRPTHVPWPGLQQEATWGDTHKDKHNTYINTIHTYVNHKTLMSSNHSWVWHTVECTLVVFVCCVFLLPPRGSPLFTLIPDTIYTPTARERGFPINAHLT